MTSLGVNLLPILCLSFEDLKFKIESIQEEECPIPQNIFFVNEVYGWWLAMVQFLQLVLTRS